MPKFLIEASYTPEGAKGVQSAGGTSRADAVARSLRASGGNSRASTLPLATPTPT